MNFKNLLAWPINMLAQTIKLLPSLATRPDNSWNPLKTDCTKVEELRLPTLKIIKWSRKNKWVTEPNHTDDGIEMTGEENSTDKTTLPWQSQRDIMKEDPLVKDLSDQKIFLKRCETCPNPTNKFTKGTNTKKRAKKEIPINRVIILMKIHLSKHNSYQHYYF